MSWSALKPIALKSIFLSGALALAPAVGASPIDVEWQVDGAHPFVQNEYATVKFTAGPGGETSPVGDGNTYGAGAFALTGWERVGPGDDDWAPVGEFVAFCIDIFANITLPTGYEPSSNGGDAGFDEGRITNLERLFNTAYGTIEAAIAGGTLTAEQSGGFQLAIWEILYEEGETLNVLKGSFRVTSSAAKYANTLLAGLEGEAEGDYQLTFLLAPLVDGVARVSQNLVTTARLPSPVPLPAGGLLLLAGLAGLGVVRGRRRPAA